MDYPTIEQVKQAELYTICYWYRFLPYPAKSADGKNREEFNRILAEEVDVMNLVCRRYKELGGITPEISKQLGWK